MRPSWLNAAVGAGAALAIVIPLAAPLAYAATDAPALNQSNWFWREQQSNIAGSGVAPPASVPDPTVPAGDLPVAGPSNKQGAEKESYVGFDLSAIPLGAVFTSFKVTMPLDPHAHQAFVPSKFHVVACAPLTSWAGGQGAESFSGKPPDDCSDAVLGAPANGGKAYAFDVTSMAQRWLGPDGINTGVALTDNPVGKTSAYQIVFGPATEVRASATWSLPPPAAQLPAPTSVPPVSTDTGSTGMPTGGQAVLPPAAPPPAAQPMAAPPPAVATPTTPPAATAPVNLRGVSTVPPGMFWVVAVLLAAVVGAAGFVLRDPIVAVPGGIRRGVGRALLRRTALRSTVPVPRSSA